MIADAAVRGFRVLFAFGTCSKLTTFALGANRNYSVPVMTRSVGFAKPKVGEFGYE